VAKHGNRALFLAVRLGDVLVALGRQHRRRHGAGAQEPVEAQDRLLDGAAASRRHA